jgi:hypothetical protein
MWTSRVAYGACHLDVSYEQGKSLITCDHAWSIIGMAKGGKEKCVLRFISNDSKLHE